MADNQQLYHFNAATGVASKCNATVRDCPLSNKFSEEQIVTLLRKMPVMPMHKQKN